MHAPSLPRPLSLCIDGQPGRPVLLPPPASLFPFQSLRAESSYADSAASTPRSTMHIMGMGLLGSPRAHPPVQPPSRHFDLLENSRSASERTAITSVMLQLMHNQAADACATKLAPLVVPSIVAPHASSTNSPQSSIADASTPSSCESDEAEDNDSSGSRNSLDASIVALYPRKKSGLRYREAVILDKKALEALYHLPLKEAARELGICPTAIKTACRKLGLPKWPYRTLRKQRRHHSLLAARVRPVSAA